MEAGDTGADRDADPRPSRSECGEQSGVDAEEIAFVMSHTGATSAEAIAALLRHQNGDTRDVIAVRNVPPQGDACVVAHPPDIQDLLDKLSPNTAKARFWDWLANLTLD